ncbi:ABC transporter substrate-binding protein [Amycolatopsis australiensis]|uniref:Amino acid ABC transporter substrate-binding protein, PAAT family n=1 Tax=Amycolatopsis australiensis TaxID=546364 RepID=A0A1K1Q9J9_9PSEU|nr:ABC transporter substrate-binding protein [Amycolatopsis australiensis]SFW56626.1 amino acid ABC transporter substrate-binding protein, PAAT family [Amycolatopsis australiensis]
MKKTLVTAIAATLLAALTACGGGSGDSGSKTLRVGTLSDSKPNAYQENGTFTGFDNELLKAIAAKENLKLEFVATDFSALLGQVANGTFDIGSSAISQTDARKKTVDFSAPYNYQALGIEAKETAGITDENSLAGKRIGVVQGTVSDTWLGSNAPAAQAVRFPNDAAALSALKTGAVDGAVFDQATAEDYAKNNPDAKLKVTKAITTTIPHGFAFKKGNTDLIGKINDGLKKVIADGTWVKVHDEFEPTAPVPAEFKPGQ